MYKIYLTFYNVFYTIFFFTFRHPYESTLLIAARKIANQSEHISYASWTPVKNAFGHSHAHVHRNNLIGVATCFRRICKSYRRKRKLALLFLTGAIRQINFRIQTIVSKKVRASLLQNSFCTRIVDGLGGDIFCYTSSLNTIWFFSTLTIPRTLIFVFRRN